MEIPYQANKARVLVMFIAGQLEMVDFSTIWKIFYLCERWHFERHGQSMVGDTYLAGQNGPIPLNALSAFVAKKNGIQGNGCIASEYKRLPTIDGGRLRMLTNETFTCDEMQSIHWALATFGSLPSAVFDESVRGIAWKSAGNSDFIWPNGLGKQIDSSAGLVDLMLSQTPKAS